MNKLTKVEKYQRRQKQLVRRALKEKQRKKRNTYLHNIARGIRAK